MNLPLWVTLSYSPYFYQTIFTVLIWGFMSLNCIVLKPYNISEYMRWNQSIQKCLKKLIRVVPLILLQNFPFIHIYPIVLSTLWSSFWCLVSQVFLWGTVKNTEKASVAKYQAYKIITLHLQPNYSTNLAPWKLKVLSLP